MIPMNQYPASSVVPILFTTYGKTNGESITLTGLAVTDIEIYKGTSMTQRSSDAGYALLDTDGIDIDTITGLHGFSIDLGDNTDAGFYAVGSFYTVVVSAVTVDAQTVTFIADRFRITPAESITGHPKTDVGGWLGTAPATPTVAGVPEVDLTHVAGSTTDVSTIPARIGDILTDTAEIGTAGAGLTNINLPNQTMDIVGNITGNLSGSVGSVTGAVGSVTGNVGGNVTGTVGSVVGAVGSVTGNVGGNVTGTVGSVVGAVGSVTGAVGSVTGNVGGNVVGSVGSLTGHTVQTGDTFARMTKAIVTGTVGAASSTTSVVTSALAPAAAVIDQFKGRVIVFDAATTTTNLRGQATDITASTALGVLTVTALTTAPVSGDTFTIV